MTGIPCGQWTSVSLLPWYYSPFYGVLRSCVTYSAFLGNSDIIYTICFILYLFLIHHYRLTQHFLILMHLGESGNFPPHPWLDMSESRGEERVCVNVLYQCKINHLMPFRASLTTAFSSRVFCYLVLLAVQCYFCVQYAA